MLRGLINVKKYQIANTIGFIAVILVNALANILPINNLNTGQISDMYPNLFVPVPLTFGIWLVIYLGLALFILYQWGFFSGWNDDYARVTADIGWMFFLSCILNSVWILVWHYLFIELSLLVMVALFFNLLIIFNRLYHRRDASQAERNWVHGPFSIYTGWITVATVANATAVLVEMDWGALGFAEPVWTAVMVAVAAIIAGLVLVKRRNILYAGVVVWTLLGIYLRHTGELARQYPVVINTVMIAGLVLLVMMLLVAAGTIGTRPRSSTVYYR